MGASPTYSYFRLTNRGNRKEEFFSYTDISMEYGVTKNTVAGKFYRAAQKNSNVISLNKKVRIERIKSLPTGDNK